MSVFRKAKLGLAGLVLGASMFFGSPKAQADDLLSKSVIPTVTSVDSDGDGLLDTDESIIGTNPNLADTDGDEYRDGLEYCNSGKADPLNFGAPSYGSNNALSDFSVIQPLTTGTTKSVISPLWVGPIGGRLAYIEADTNFGNGTLFIKNIFDFDSSRTQLDTGLDAQLRQLGAGPLGTRIYYHTLNSSTGKEEIYKVGTLTGIISRAIPGIGNTLEYSVRNPTLFADADINRDTGRFEMNGEFWALCETDKNGQIYAFKLLTSGLRVGNWDGSMPVKVTNSSNKVIIPKVSRTGDKLMFTEHIPEGSNTFICNELRSVLEGVNLAYNTANWTADLRMSKIARSPPSGVSLPGGFDSDERLAYWFQDCATTPTYTLNNPLDLSNSDFDVKVSRVGIDSNGRFNTVSPGIIRIPFPGNQMFPNLKGGRLVFSDDYLQDSPGNFNAYATGIKAATRIAGAYTAALVNGLSVPGITLEDNSSTFTIDTGGFNRIFQIIPSLNPLSSATLTGSGITDIKDLSPDGFRVIDTLDPNPSTASESKLRATVRWTPESLVMPDDSVLDENTISFSYKDLSGNFVQLGDRFILERNIPGRYMKIQLPHCSEWGLNMEQLQLITRAKNWDLYSNTPFNHLENGLFTRHEDFMYRNRK